MKAGGTERWLQTGIVPGCACLVSLGLTVIIYYVVVR